MYHFQYVSRNQRRQIKKELIEIIHQVQNYVRKEFTFQFQFIGSDQRNMVTCDFKSNTGFDFDVNLELSNNKAGYSPKQIKECLLHAFSLYAQDFGYDPAENSTRVITIKIKDKKHSRILHSCDFAIVNNYFDGEDELQEYIRFNKAHNSYSWEEQSTGYYNLPHKEHWIKSNGYWNDVLDLYLEKKNKNPDPQHKHSRTIYAETLHEICQRYGYYE